MKYSLKNEKKGVTKSGGSTESSDSGDDEYDSNTEMSSSKGHEV